MDPTKLITRIRQEFHKMPVPTLPDGWERFTDDISSPYYAEAIEETKPFWGKDWDDLTLQDFDDCRCVLGFLPDDAMLFFLGGYMVLSINENEFDSMAFDRFLFHKPLSKKPKHIHREFVFMRMILKPLSKAQREVFSDYLTLRDQMKTDCPSESEFTQAMLRGEILP